MPLLAIRTNVVVGDAELGELLLECSSRVAGLLGKPEDYVMTMFERVAAMTMAGRVGPACLVEVRGVGKISSGQARGVSAALTEILSTRLGVPSGSIYLNFMEFSGAMWGFDGGTFG
ncbi:MAG: phenylpyruvate tautomerase MIF-related protein [Polyangiaceae bacterium]|nr:phenylpyruvate tautomerase MIF-related protein [Polyangiaceae bacterium]